MNNIPPSIRPVKKVGVNVTVIALVVQPQESDRVCAREVDDDREAMSGEDKADASLDHMCVALHLESSVERVTYNDMRSYAE